MTETFRLRAILNLGNKLAQLTPLQQHGMDFRAAVRVDVPFGADVVHRRKHLFFRLIAVQPDEF